MAPPEKKLKTNDGEEVATAAGAEETAAAAATAALKGKMLEPPKEEETDAADIKGSKVKEVAVFAHDTTLNVVPADGGHSVYMTLNEGGMHHYVAGIRANTGISKGRYMFEVKVVEHVGIPASAGAHAGPPKNFVRVGVSSADAHLVAGSTAESLVFESNGAVMCDRARTKGSGANFGVENVVAVLVNLEEGHKNYQTISLFVDGKRASQPQPLPEALKGKTLYPAVGFKNSTVHVNLGAVALFPLPFACHMVGAAAQADCVVSSQPAGKPEVVFPVLLPEEGAMDWLDMFVEKNPTFTVLSDRMLLEWAERSGIWRKGGYLPKTCNDRPGKNFQVAALDDESVRTALYKVAPLSPRNYIVMEIKGNLIEDERQKVLARFPSSVFKKTATVLVGEPTPDFAKRTQDIMLKAKQEVSDRAFKAKKVVEKRARDEERKKNDTEEKRQRLAEKKEADAKKATEGEERTDEEKKAEEEEQKAEDEKKAEEEKQLEETRKAEDEAEMAAAPPAVELSLEERSVKFRKLQTPDLSPLTLSSSFQKFSLPGDHEGFDEIMYAWQKADKCKEYVSAWAMEKKLSIRVEDLKPSVWSQGKMRQWQASLNTWQARLRGYYQNHAAKVARVAKAKQAKEAIAKAKEIKAAREAAAKEAKAAAGETEDKAEEEAEEKTEEKEAEAEEDEEMPIDFDKVDVFGVADVLDVGAGIPLFRDFQPEDWAMLTLRFELHLLAHAFRKDVGDAERPGISLEHLGFYYNRYFKKNLSPKDWGVEEVAAVVKLVQDAVYVRANPVVLESQLDSDMETFAVFIKLTEEARRDRKLQLALGENNAKLHIAPTVLSAAGLQRPHVSAALQRPHVSAAVRSTGAAPSVLKPGNGLKPGGLKPTMLQPGAASGLKPGWTKGGPPRQLQPGAYGQKGYQGGKGGIVPLLPGKGAWTGGKGAKNQRF